MKKTILHVPPDAVIRVNQTEDLSVAQAIAAHLIAPAEGCGRDHYVPASAAVAVLHVPMRRRSFD